MQHRISADTNDPLNQGASAGRIGRAIRELYEAHPFPQTTREQRHKHFPFELCKYKFLGLDAAMRGARVIDVGVGTGRSMLVARHYDVREYVGLDFSRASLRLAEQAAREEDFDRFTPVEGDLFAIPYPDASFDVAVSWGVLHHTTDPFRGLAEMVRVCRPGGFVAIYVYNAWNHWRHNVRKRRIERIAGPDVERQFEVAHRLYGRKPLADMTEGEKMILYDRYCIPYRSEHSFGEVLEWFDRLGLEFYGSCRPLRFRDVIRYLKYLNQIMSDRPPGSDYGHFVRTATTGARLAALIPLIGEPREPYRRPTWVHCLFWQALIALQGLNPTTSLSHSFSARKK